MSKIKQLLDSNPSDEKHLDEAQYKMVREFKLSPHEIGFADFIDSLLTTPPKRKTK